MKVDKKSMELYVVTDRSWLAGRSLEGQVEEILAAGATFLQIREKDLDFNDFVAEGKKLKKIADKYQVPFVVNDSVDVAIAVGADGVHIGQSDGNVATIRKALGEDKILGVSAQTVEAAMAAERDGADYLGVGAVFHTGTKSDADQVSRKTLCDICRSVSIPVIGIGGICEDNILSLTGSGIDGVAVISAIFAKEKIGEATYNLLQLSKLMTKKGYIFDLDGTVLDSMHIWKDVGREYLESKNMNNIPKDIAEILKPMTLEEAAEYFIENLDMQLSVVEIEREAKELISHKYVCEVGLKSGIADFLEKSKNSNIKMCVATASDKYLTTMALKRLGILDYFDFILTSDEVGNSKVEPDIFLMSAEKLGLSACDVAVFEDAYHAVETAKNAGFYVVGVEDKSAENDKVHILKTCHKYITCWECIL